MENDEFFIPEDDEKDTFHIDAPEEESNSSDEEINIEDFLGALGEFESQTEKNGEPATEQVQQAPDSLPSIPAIGKENSVPFKVHEPIIEKHEAQQEENDSTSAEDDSFEEMIKELDENTADGKSPKEPATEETTNSQERHSIADEDTDEEEEDKNSDEYKAQVRKNQASIVTQLINKSIKRNNIDPPQSQLRNQFKDKFQEFENPNIEEPRPVQGETKVNMFQPLSEEQALEEASKKTEELFKEGLGDLNAPGTSTKKEEKKDDLVSKFMQKIKSVDYLNKNKESKENSNEDEAEETITNEDVVEETTEGILAEPEPLAQDVVEETTEEVLAEPEQLAQDVVEETTEEVLAEPEQLAQDVVEETTEEVLAEPEQLEQDVVEETTEEVLTEPEQSAQDVVEETTEKVLTEPEQAIEEISALPPEEMVAAPEQFAQTTVQENTESSAEDTIHPTEPTIDTIEQNEDADNSQQPIEELEQEQEPQIDNIEQEPKNVAEEFDVLTQDNKDENIQEQQTEQKDMGNLADIALPQPQEEPMSNNAESIVQVAQATPINAIPSSAMVNTVTPVQLPTVLQLQEKNLALKADDSVRVMFTTAENIIIGNLQVPEIVHSDGLSKEELMYQILNCDYKFAALKDCNIMDKDNTEFEPEKVKFYLLNTDIVLSCKVVPNIEKKGKKKKS